MQWNQGREFSFAWWVTGPTGLDPKEVRGREQVTKEKLRHFSYHSCKEVGGETGGRCEETPGAHHISRGKGTGKKMQRDKNKEHRSRGSLVCGL